jgi:hypothetical protein
MGRAQHQSFKLRKLSEGLGYEVRAAPLALKDSWEAARKGRIPPVPLICI